MNTEDFSVARKILAKLSLVHIYEVGIANSTAVSLQRVGGNTLNTSTPFLSSSSHAPYDTNRQDLVDMVVMG